MVLILLKRGRKGARASAAKSSLIDFYKDKMGARHLYDQMMSIEGNASIALLERFKEGD